MRRIKLRYLTLTGGAALIVGGLWAFQFVVTPADWTDVPNQAAESLSAVGMNVKEVLVTGRTKTPAADILDALGAVRGTPILEIDVPSAKARITALPWVRSAEIVRHLPGSLHINIDEYDAYALWQHNGGYTLIDGDGTSIINVDSAPANLIVVVGEDAPAHTQALFEALEQHPELFARVKAAVRFGNRRWNVTLDDVEHGVVIKLPEHGVTDAWSGLASLDAKHQLLSRALAEIDLRIEGRLTVQLKEGYAPLPQQSQYNSPLKRDVRTGAQDLGNQNVGQEEFSKGV
ncbi:MAG: FtsQ-type POTRA domain-containing protein [Rhodospirillaceae bacterium]|jgi:cell division protein FtsQ